MAYSAELGGALRALLFERNDHVSPVTYTVKPGAIAMVLATWAVHGVCHACEAWSISAGRCADCGRHYRTAHGLTVAEQVTLAKRLLREAKKGKPWAISPTT